MSPTQGAEAARRQAVAQPDAGIRHEVQRAAGGFQPAVVVRFPEAGLPGLPVSEKIPPAIDGVVGRHVPRLTLRAASRVVGVAQKVGRPKGGAPPIRRLDRAADRRGIEAIDRRLQPSEPVDRRFEMGCGGDDQRAAGGGEAASPELRHQIARSTRQPGVLTEFREAGWRFEVAHHKNLDAVARLGRQGSERAAQRALLLPGGDHHREMDGGARHHVRPQPRGPGASKPTESPPATRRAPGRRRTTGRRRRSTPAAPGRPVAGGPLATGG